MSYGDQKIKQNTKFLKIEAGEPMVIRLLDTDPFEVMKHQLKTANAEGKFQVLCKGEDQCELCADGDEPKQKFITNVYNHTLQKVQLFEYGTLIAKMLQKIALDLTEEQQDIMNFDLKCSAEGTKLTKKYTITVRTSSQPTPTGLVKHKIDGDIPF